MNLFLVWIAAELFILGKHVTINIVKKNVKERKKKGWKKMTTQAEKFGKQLRKFRLATHDNERPNKLSRRRFGIELARMMKLKFEINDDTIYNLEAGRNKGLYQDRELIKAILQVLLRFGGISKLEEANQLLELAGNGPLLDFEIEQINKNWLVKQTSPLYPTHPARQPVSYDPFSGVNRYFEERRVNYEDPKKIKKKSS
jgi:hypothetical protein